MAPPPRTAPPGLPLTAHWGLPDPVKSRGPEAESALAFAALALAELDRLALQRGLDQIARTPDRN